MTTVDKPNVHAVAIEGTFDDCQSIVKALFNDLAFRDAMKLSGVNSINWARILAQIVYYFTSAVALGAPDRRVSFAVPTGNFGDVLAGYYAKRMGLSIDRLAIATNENDILARALASGVYKPLGVKATQSPSMDIQVSSNFERLLFEAYDRDAGALRALMGGLRQSGEFAVAPGPLAAIRRDFDAYRVDEETCTQEIGRAYRSSGVVIDPHTAVGVNAARRALARDPATPVVALATAHPAKFPDAVERAIGQRPVLPTHLRDIEFSPGAIQRSARTTRRRWRNSFALARGRRLERAVHDPAFGPARRHRRDAAFADGLARRLRQRGVAARVRRRTRPLASARTHGVQGNAPAQRARNRRGDRKRRRRSQRRDRRRADRLFRPRAGRGRRLWRSTSSRTS